ncbi:adhesion G protein-coupled receptor E5 isoform X2 [Xenopus laevis]|uniref:Adhesion G protein-coupled receptor E5 isoform X2 n=1 Tax=Xenopus laevis TaxID=8355 RepID=A0A8J1MQ05_XENLA|nr:adhesion G protein-coupled receptor E5 isoform X2 [Xenopus laevis]
MDHLTFYCALFLLIFGYSTAANDSEEINECIIQSYSTAANNNEETNQSIKHVKEENCISVPGFYLPECDDINECWGNPKLCGAHTQCNNTVGGYKCVCESGFQTKLNKTEFCHNETYNTCEDINECDTNTHKCGANTKCKNTKGGYLCLCNPGYLKKNNTVKFTPTDNKEDNKCEDINECDTNTHKCGANTTCKNTKGGYECQCEPGYHTKNNTVKFTPTDNKCEVKCNGSDSGMKSSDLFQCFMDNLISSLAPSSNKVDHFQRIQQLLDELNGIIDRIPRRSIQERLRGTGKVLKQVERIVRNLSLSYGGNITAKSKNNRTELLTLSGSRKSKLISLQSRRSRLQVDPQTAAADSGDDFPFVGFLEYNSLAPLLEGAGIVGGSNSSTVHLISPVISTFLSRENTSSLNSSITFRLQHTAINITIDPSKTTCAFWSQEDVAWSTAGCITLESSKQETNCSCVHMTSFAILMATNNVEELVKSWPLTLITRIGLSISIICLSLSIITFIFCRSLRGTRNTIHTHLCISLFLGHCIFLLGITANHNLVACSVVAGLLHAFYLASFFWMSLEAVELYLMLVKVFNTHLKKRYLLLIGYGVPLAIVTISASVYPGGYGTKLHCWLSLERNFIWSFMGPVCMILLVNSGIFVLTVWKLAEKMSQINPEMEKYKRIRSLTVTAVAQLSILGCCWVFGFLQFGSTSLFFAYAFSILNMLQGLQIFIFHCLMNKKVRADYARWLCAIAHFKAPSYSEFSSNSQTQTRNKNTNKDSSL